MIMNASFRKNEIVYGSVYGVFQFLFLPSLAAALIILMDLPTWIMQFGIFLLNFLVTVLIFRYFLLQSCKDALSRPGRFFAYTGLGLVIFYASTLLISFLIFAIKPDYANLNDEGISQLAEDSGIWIALGTVLLVPVAEECLFRGLLFRAIYEKHPILAWIISAAAFSAVHVLSYLGSYNLGSTVLAFIQYLPAGLSLCYAYKATGTILSPILMHSLINLISVSLLT